MANELSAGPPVPDAYPGVWKRRLLRSARIEDITTQVYWMQTRSWHADIRVPANRSECRGKDSLAQLTRDELFGLARQQGFSGTTEIDGNICRWLRRHDFQPPTGANDIGRMEFETPDRVLEYGVEADYFEVWERMPGSVGNEFAVQLSQDPLVLLLGSGRYRMQVRPRTGTLDSAPNFSALAADLRDETLRPLLDFEISFGTMRDASSWEVELSTLPWLEGIHRPAAPTAPQPAVAGTGANDATT
jgi:hypothetical protein